ncbi:hypothetical protein A2392_00560 [Candidatus Kaiserbacteria bacterium RIFOXYB1_FULL_46_14]|uniref:VanZ-like domain-containing protein n=1 Tax=Candidatus Kaiserbacteria bacterium RIFOXYB1_FULL_46_14 TaxID=1798531 RepID=A0A1F6FJ65_9BACT|nr:MAG: hypothetical protein A2392_00560 [Candidatus Kaiserbacteria bacterium RIFOXYB1_FULL_46_14]
MIKSNTIVLLLTLSVLSVTHFLSLNFYLYWIYPWLDSVTHTLGGVAVALGWFSLRDLHVLSSERWFRFLPSMFSVLAVALSWELFEVAIGVSIHEPGYIGDTISDIIFGFSGGLFGYVMAKSLHDNL